MKKYFSVPLYIVIGLAVLYLGWAAGRAGYYWARTLRFEYNWRRAQREYERPFREDKIGGQTPEETWDMFISALGAGDVEKASGYFHVATRENEKRYITEKINDKGKDSFLQYYKDVSGRWKKEQGITERDINFVYKYHRENSVVEFNDGSKHNLPAGEYESRVEFKKNINDVWKIYHL